MKKHIDITLPPAEAFEPDLLTGALLRKAGASEKYGSVRLVKRSIDARKKPVKVRIAAEVYVKEEPPSLLSYTGDFPVLQSGSPVIIIGAGPAGLFAALRCLESGVKPVILERGSDVRTRRRDIAAINKQHIVNPESNYCFGEGGAGTYSDGKLYTRSKKRGDVRRILEILVHHGASEEILFEAHPHIGTNKLPNIIQSIREKILSGGGEVHFDQRVDDLILQKGEIRGVKLQDGTQVEGRGVILATGHSARDMFILLQSKGILIEAKPFALGIRIEHPQELIDQIQYHCKGKREEYLPASAYSLVHQTVNAGTRKGVFSFCMCPGGFVVPAATAPGEVVVNGMSPSRRDSRFANSGIVVAVELSDLHDFARHGPLAGMYYQQQVEQQACHLAGNDQTAPAQRMTDFLQRRVSDSLPETSYQPGLRSVDLWEVLPEDIYIRLQQAIRAFGKTMKGFVTREAQLIGVESRTSSPVRIPRNKTTLEHVEVKRLFPCGEGAGYAGGIVSAAMDGERSAEALMELYVQRN